jgi:hypothetical protein
MSNLQGFNAEFASYYKTYFKLLSYEFSEWLIGLQEDEPLPFEINLATFIISKNSNLYSLAYSGHEQKKLTKLVAGEYIPLEGQYFFSKYLMTVEFLTKNEKQKRNFLIFLITQLITDFLKTNRANFLNNKSIAIGFEFDEPVYIK